MDANDYERPVKRCAYCTAVCSPRSYVTHVVCMDCRKVATFNAWADRHGVDLTTIDDDYHLRLMTSKIARGVLEKRLARERQKVAV